MSCVLHFFLLMVHGLASASAVYVRFVVHRKQYERLLETKQPLM